MPREPRRSCGADPVDLPPGDGDTDFQASATPQAAGGAEEASLADQLRSVEDGMRASHQRLRNLQQQLAQYQEWSQRAGRGAGARNKPQQRDALSPAPRADSRGPEGDGMEAGTRVGDVLFTVPRVLELAGWRAVVRCKGVCRAWRRQLASPFWFSVMNKAIARECALYLPLQATSGPERLFWDQLHPARGKWLREGEDGADGASAAAAQSFSIRVAVRFRPSRTAGKVRSFVLPLHQRLRLRRRGEQLHFEEEARGLDSDRLQGMVEAGEELPPDLIRALLEARRLEHLSRQAETGTTAADHWRDTSADEGRAAERAVGLGEAERSLSDGVEGVHGPEVPGEAAMVASSAESRSDLRDPTGGDSATAAADDLPLTSHKRKTGERARVMAVRKASVTVFVPGAGLRPFAFERVFDACAAQEQVYREAAQSAVISALNGFNACLFVYGQTGSGKTHTVFGPPGTLDCPFGDPSSLPSSAGLALRACRELIAGCDSMEGTRASLSATYVEIYQEKVTDLIGGGPVTLRAAGGGQVSLSGACETAVESMADLVDLLRRGDARKHSAATRMNARSSRAHTILVIKITQARDHRVISSHLHLVDLAGCEQLHQSGARGQQRREVSAGLADVCCWGMRCESAAAAALCPVASRGLPG